MKTPIVFIVVAVAFLAGYVIGAKTFFPGYFTQYVPNDKNLVECMGKGGKYTVEKWNETCQITTTQEIFSHVLGADYFNYANKK